MGLVDYVRVSFSYDRDSGELRWRNDRNSRAPAGKLFGYRRESGRRHGQFMGRKYFATHIIWLLVHGRLPRAGMVIDHINGDPSDDRLANLQEITGRLNICKGSLCASSPIPGVRRSKTSNGKSIRWRAQFVDGGVRRERSFPDMQMAIAQRRQWEMDSLRALEQSDKEGA